MSDQKSQGKDVDMSVVQTEDSSTAKHARSTSGASSKATMYLEIYRITTEFLPKLVLPAMLGIIVITFRPTIDSLLRRTTDAEIAGAKFKFVQKVSESIEQAKKTGDIKEIEAVVTHFRKAATSDVISSFLWPDGNRTKPVNQDNVRRVRDWMDNNDLRDLPVQI